MSIADEITRLQTDSSAIAAAIAAKGVTVPSGSGYDDYASLIATIPTGGGGSKMPEWLKDGDTHLWINLVSPYQLTVTLRLRITGTIDWGDGTTESATMSSRASKTHTYSSLGQYRIDLKPSSGSFFLGNATSGYCIMGARSAATWGQVSALYQAEIGTKQITSLSNYSFYYCNGLKRIYIPKTITEIGTNMFYDCMSLSHVIFEDSSTITTTSAMTSMFYNCYSLQDVSTFIPTGITAMPSFRYNYSLLEITIPAQITSIPANAFASAYSLQKMICKPATPPTVAASSSFSSMNENIQIIVPRGKLSAYQSATYWSDFSSNMVEASS